MPTHLQVLHHVVGRVDEEARDHRIPGSLVLLTAVHLLGSSSSMQQ